MPTFLIPGWLSSNPGCAPRKLAAPVSMDALGYARSMLYNGLHLWKTRRRSEPCAINGTSIDLVTIVFKSELDLLALQARSFDRFLESSFTGRIFVVVNDLHCGELARRIETDVRPQYGRWRDRVSIIPFHRLGYRLDPSNGWIVQQALKLASSRMVTQPHYVVFDAKNHLVAPTSVRRFVDADGFALQSLEPDAAHLPHHRKACASYFGIDPHDRTVLLFVPMTPFVLHTQSVRDLVQHIETREAQSFSAFFCGRKKFLSEFLLYGAYLEAHRGGTTSLYRTTECNTVTIWPKDDVGASIASVEEQATICFGVHRNYLAGADANGIGLLLSFWQRLGLLEPGETLVGLARQPAKHETLSRWATMPMIGGAVVATLSVTVWRDLAAASVIALAAAAIGLGSAALKSRGRYANALLMAASLAASAALATTLGLAFQKDTRVEGEGELIAHDGPLGWTLRPGVHRVTKTVNDLTIYDVTYTIDGEGHRTTQAAQSGGAVAFLGDSFTFGEGLPDRDTLPQAFADLTGRRLRVVNLGVSAYSPAQVLRELQLGLYDNVLKPAKVFFLLTASWHVDRIACLDDWVVGAPRYVVQGLELVSDGQCPNPPEPGPLVGLFRRTPIYRALFAGKLPFVDQDEIATYIRVVVEIAKIAKTKYGVPLEILYLRNAGYLRFTGMSDDDIILRLRAGGADVLDMTLPHEGKAGFAILGDGHPNGVGNRLRAQMLVDALSADKSGLLTP